MQPIAASTSTRVAAVTTLALFLPHAQLPSRLTVSDALKGPNLSFDEVFGVRWIVPTQQAPVATLVMPPCLTLSRWNARPSHAANDLAL